MEVFKSKNDIIRYVKLGDEPHYVACDIAKFLGYKPTSFRRNFKKFEKVQIESNMRGFQTTMIIDQTTLNGVLIKLKSHKTEELCEELDLPLMHVKILSSETETLLFIIRCFLNRYKMIREYRVGKYRVDLYFLEKNIVIECDEDDHKHYNQEREIERTLYISEKLGNPTWIRYNPETMDMPEIINRIVEATMKT